MGGVIMANITIDKSCCKGCDICYAVCPKKIFVRSKNRNHYGTNMPDTTNPETCIYCGMCERMCPDGAIDVQKEEPSENEN
jgi:2-oxoglutarate ferredoxin oxidoreductase subunit delta